MRIVAIGCVLLLAAGTLQAADLYRWVDAQGKVHYTDNPPPEGARQVEQKKVADPAALDADGNLPYAFRQAAKRYPLTLYVTSRCDACDQARQLLAKRGVPFDERNPETSPEHLEALKKAVGSPLVPVLLVGTMAPIKGFEAEKWDGILDAASYPRSLPPGFAPKKKAAAKAPPVEVKPDPAVPAQSDTPAQPAGN